MSTDTQIATQQDITDAIKHAFDDASLNASMEGSRREAKRAYRDMLDMHFEITQERYNLTDEEFADLVEKTAEEIGALQDYNWAYGKSKPQSKNKPARRTAGKKQKANTRE